MKCLQQCKQYRLLVLCTFLMIMTLMTLPRSVSAGGRRSKQSRHSLDRRNGRERLPIQPDDPSGSSRGRGRGSRKKASGKFSIKKLHKNKDMKNSTYHKYIFDYFLHNVSLQDNTKLLDVICFYLIATLNRVHLKYMFEALSC